MDSTKRGADPDRLAICDEVDEVVDVVTTRTSIPIRSAAASNA